MAGQCLLVIDSIYVSTVTEHLPQLGLHNSVVEYFQAIKISDLGLLVSS